MSVCNCKARCDFSSGIFSPDEREEFMAWGNLFFRWSRRMCANTTVCNLVSTYGRIFPFGNDTLRDACNGRHVKTHSETNLNFTNTFGYLSSALSTTHRKRQIYWKNKLTFNRLWMNCSRGIFAQNVISRKYTTLVDTTFENNRRKQFYRDELIIPLAIK